MSEVTEPAVVGEALPCRDGRRGDRPTHRGAVSVGVEAALGAACLDAADADGVIRLFGLSGSAPASALHAAFAPPAPPIGPSVRLGGTDDQQRHRYEGLVRLAHRVLGATDPNGICEAVLDEAVQTVGAAGGAVYRWDDCTGAFALVKSTLTRPLADDELAHHSASADAATAGHAAISAAELPAGSAPDLGSLLVAPLRHDSRALGVLVLAAHEVITRGSPYDAETVRLLTDIAAEALIGLERARLAGARLAMWTAQHELNNRLARMATCAELIADDPDLPAPLRGLALKAIEGAEQAAAVLKRMQELSRLVERDRGPMLSPILDLGQERRD